MDPFSDLEAAETQISVSVILKIIFLTHLLNIDVIRIFLLVLLLTFSLLVKAALHSIHNDLSAICWRSHENVSRDGTSWKQTDIQIV